MKTLYYDKEVPLINYKVIREYPSDFNGNNPPRQILGYYEPEPDDTLLEISSTVEEGSEEGSEDHIIYGIEDTRERLMLAYLFNLEMTTPALQTVHLILIIPVANNYL